MITNKTTGQKHIDTYNITKQVQIMVTLNCTVYW